MSGKTEKEKTNEPALDASIRDYKRYCMDEPHRRKSESKHRFAPAEHNGVALGATEYSKGFEWLFDGLESPSEVQGIVALKDYEDVKLTWDRDQKSKQPKQRTEIEDGKDMFGEKGWTHFKHLHCAFRLLQRHHLDLARLQVDGWEHQLDLVGSLDAVDANLRNERGMCAAVLRMVGIVCKEIGLGSLLKAKNDLAVLAEQEKAVTVTSLADRLKGQGEVTQMLTTIEDQSPKISEEDPPVNSGQKSVMERLKDLETVTRRYNWNMIGT